MWILVLAGLLQSDPMEDILKRFSQEKVELRDQASQDIVSRWKEWTESDLSKLRAAQDSTDPELRSRAKDCFDRILFNKSFPERLWTTVPNLGQILRSGTPADIVDLLRSEE